MCPHEGWLRFSVERLGWRHPAGLGRSLGAWAAVQVHSLRRERALASVHQWALNREPTPCIPAPGNCILLEGMLTIWPNGPTPEGCLQC